MNRGEWQDVFNWAWNDVWPNHLRQELDVGDWDRNNRDDREYSPDEGGRARVAEALALTAELYEKHRAKGNSHEDAKHRTFEDIMRIANPPAPPTPGIVTTPLSARGRSFYAADSQFDYREIGAFTLYDQWLLYGPREMAYYPKQARDYGATALRVMLHLGGSDYWRSRTRDGKPVVFPSLDDPTYIARLPEFCDWLAAHGLYTRVCIFGGIDGPRWPVPDRRDHWSGNANAERRRWVTQRTSDVATSLLDTPTKLYEITNEFNQIGWGSHYDAIAALTRQVKAIDAKALVTGSQENGPNADAPSFVGAPNDYTDSHLDRRRGYGGFEWVKRSSETPVIDDNPAPFVSGEPINFGSAAPGRRDGDDNERSPAVALAYAATSRMKGYYTNFHAEAVLNCDNFDGPTAECARAWQLGLDLIPWDIHRGFRNGHWAESPFIATGTLPSSSDNEETWRGIIRIFGRSDGLWVSVGHRRGFNPPVKSGRAVTALAQLAHGDYECRVWKE